MIECSKKKRYINRVEALIALANTQRKRKRTEERAYWCRLCGYWYLTSQSKARQ